MSEHIDDILQQWIDAELLATPPIEPAPQLRERVATLARPSLSVCSNCCEPKQPHRACANCGYYKGQRVFTPTES